VSDVRIGREPFGSDIARRLVAALDADLDERYADDDAAAVGEPDYAMLNVLHDTVAPPVGVFLVAWLDDAPVGCGALRPGPTSDDGIAEVKRMYVVPAARGQGISRRLLAALEAEAFGFGYRRLILETGIRQQEAMALYESSGYRRIPNYGAYRDSTLSRCYDKSLPVPGP
jgi:GNAT superfamily N-acetyltransferase